MASVMPEKIVIHANKVPWQQEYLPRFISGFTKHGFTVEVSPYDLPVAKAINVVFANNSWKKTVASQENVMTVNRCFFGSRFDMVAIGWGGFNGQCDFCVRRFMPDDRWKKHGVPLRVNGGDPDGYILVCGEYRPMWGWYRQIHNELSTAGVSMDDVRFRPHPFRQNELPNVWQRAPGKVQDDIETALAGARACITYDSIAGCDAVWNGVPSIAYGRYSMAWDVSWPDWESFTHNEPTGDVYAWASRLAYCQWSHKEIIDGEFWDHLKARYTRDS